MGHHDCTASIVANQGVAAAPAAMAWHYVFRPSGRTGKKPRDFTLSQDPTKGLVSKISLVLTKQTVGATGVGS